MYPVEPTTKTLISLGGLSRNEDFGGDSRVVGVEAVTRLCLLLLNTEVLDRCEGRTENEDGFTCILFG